MDMEGRPDGEEMAEREDLWVGCRLSFGLMVMIMYLNSDTFLIEGVSRLKLELGT